MSSGERHLTPALTTSLAVHAFALLLLLSLFRSIADHEPTSRISLKRAVPLIWTPDPRPAARAGGGPPPAQAPPKPDKPPTVATRPPIVPLEPPVIAPEPEPRVIADTTRATSPSSTDAASHQPAGLGDKNGKGSGSGPDTGPGHDGDFFGVGDGVTSPVPLRQPPPAYTSDAMRARLQGVVTLTCVVQTDGRCSDIRVTRSLDTVFGLDQQAIASAREWQFIPGRRLGQPVPVRVTLEITFTIR
ncbi:MAG TPA: TonB family protein [Vicinamibacterales bacterium]|nr:TonB family protein [Vicinamibacterales bacterium]